MPKITSAFKLFFLSPIIISFSTFSFSQEELLTVGVSNLPEISASYKVEVIPNDQENNNIFSEDIIIWRQHDLFEIQHLDSTFGEYWRLLKSGRVEYSWIHHNRKFIVKHEPTFINSPSAGLASWESKATFVSQDLLEQLSKKSDSNFLGYPSEEYEGTLDGEFISIIWLPTLSVPVSIKQEQEGNEYILTLQEIYPLDQSPWASINTVSYKDVEYVDFDEDEQNDPDVRFYLQVLDQEGHAH